MIFLIGGLVVTALAACFLAALGYQLMQQSGRIIERVETLEGIVTGKILEGGGSVFDTLGLPLGSVAPGFELPDLSGQQRSFGEWRGRRTLLVFFDPDSYHSLRLLDALRTLHTDVATGSRPTPVLVTVGDAAKARSFFNAQGADFPVLLQPDGEVAASYMVDATPAAYIISQDGLIEGGIVYGLQAVLVAAGEILEPGAVRQEGPPRRTGENVPAQEGLSAGTQAPIFRLPKLGGGEVSLLEYRGKDTLLVFSDPDCERCVELLPELVRLAESKPELAVVMVSRGDEAANQQHLAASHATFTVGVQRNWEVSRDYGMMATPIGYLIDEWGIISSGVAIGNEAILELVR